MLSPIYVLSHGKSPANRVILGFGTSILMAVSVFLYYLMLLSFTVLDPKLPESFDRFLKMNELNLCIVCVGGIMGGITSIVTRIREFDRMVNVDDTVLFYTGFFNPLVGVFFAIFCHFYQ